MSIQILIFFLENDHNLGEKLHKCHDFSEDILSTSTKPEEN